MGSKQIDLRTWWIKLQKLTDLVWFVHQGDLQSLNQGQMDFAGEFCMKLVPNVPCHVLN
jgi:hypothetical protein